IHTTGRCDAPDFQTAGGHLNPTGTKHGLSNPAGPHQGDLPQLTVGSDGKVEVPGVEVFPVVSHDAPPCWQRKPASSPDRAGDTGESALWKPLGSRGASRWRRLRR
ncbi:MAG: hypothetical protein B7Z32_13305, partial [Hydrogenophilales bacterium 12-64-13]